MSEVDKGAVRLDKWLWAARFYKTRQIAIDAINAGRVEVNGERAKPSKSVKVGDTMRVRRPPYEILLKVTAISEKRGSATIARELYAETAESIAAREQLQAELRDMPPPIFKGRPTKKDRRTIENWQRAAALTSDDE
ncbi:MAG: RNA-binding S4 domain-containing protein [Betaproteobacteria bacterium]|nr:RNA-binding S4 domain-containing protein [Betaproteobacteria bacterium]